MKYDELIDALRKRAIELPERFSKNALNIDLFLKAADAIEELQADVRPAVRGHWIGTKEAEDMGDIMKAFTCSVCGCCAWDCTESESFNFCPNCGADMREPPKEET